MFLQRSVLTFILCAFCLGAVPAWGDGHGPAFGYSTTLLGEGDASIETSFMWRSGVAMISPVVSYGWKENLQFSVSSPFDLNQSEHPVGRITATMPGIPEVEGLLAWRFLHKSTGISTRNEATLYFGGSASTQLLPRADGPALQREPGIYAAMAAGHISRRYYVWGGAGYQHYGRWSSGDLDHESDSMLSSFVIGWRPPFLDREYPKPDFRFFWETTGDWIGHAERGPVISNNGVICGHDGCTTAPPPTPSGVTILPNSGGTGIYTGPSFLCTYKNVAFQTGVLYGAWNRLNGVQPPERFRVVVGISYFFLGGRRK
jgi:hypothetical protein